MEHLLSSSTFLALAATEYSFHQVKPSLMVSAAILTTIHGLAPTISSQTGFQNLLCTMTGIKMYDLVLLVRQLEVRVHDWIKVATKHTPQDVNKTKHTGEAAVSQSQSKNSTK